MSRIQSPRFRRRMIPFIAGLFLAACAQWQPALTRVSTPHGSIEVPDGWMRLHTPDYEMFSKDGPYLQFILFQCRPITHRFRFTRQRMAPDMLPHEVAQVIISNLRSDPQIKKFTLISNQPAMVSDEVGFRLEYTYIDPQGVENQGVYYGVLLTDVFINLQYTAARRYYFDKDAAVFEHLCKRVRLFSGTRTG